MNYLDFKPLTPADLPAVLELDRLCFGGWWSLDSYQRELNSDCSHFLLLFASNSPQDDSKLVGLGCYWSILEEAHITLLAIHPEYRRRGWGQLVLSGLLAKARSQGLARATLEVRSSNQVAISLYQKFGFQLAGRRPGYYQDNNEDALVLWRGSLQEPEFSAILTHITPELHQISLRAIASRPLEQ